MRKLFFATATLFVFLLCTTAICFAESDETHFVYDEGDGSIITQVVLVENGVPRALTKSEYEHLLRTEFIEDIEGDASGSGKTMLSEDSGVVPRTSLYYKFVPKEISRAYVGSMIKRVSVIFERAKSISVTNSMSVTREVVKNGGITVNASITDAVDLGVKAQYGMKKTASSGIDQNISGVFEPTGKKRYAAIVFTPRIATISGVLQYRQEWQGSDTLLSSYQMTWKYPCISSYGVLDGTYKLQESDSRADFPDLP